jgi:hypothetical protein
MVGDVRFWVTGKRTIRDLEICLLCIEHAKAIVMFSGEDKVSHACIFCRLRPLVGVKFYGIEIL